MGAGAVIGIDSDAYMVCGIGHIERDAVHGPRGGQGETGGEDRRWIGSGATDKARIGHPAHNAVYCWGRRDRRSRSRRGCYSKCFCFRGCWNHSTRNIIQHTIVNEIPNIKPTVICKIKSSRHINLSISGAIT